MTSRFPRLLSYALCGALFGACGDDDKNDSTVDAGSVDASTLIDAALGTTADGGVANVPTKPADELYLVATSIETADEANLLVMTGNALNNTAIDPKKAQQFPGGGSVAPFGDKFYVAESEAQTVTRYTLESGALVKGPIVNFSGRGFKWFAAYFDIATAERAFLVNDAQLKLSEWNPSTMTITADHDLSALKREGWGHEFRGSFYRPSDGKLFLYWTYTNDRKDFINNFVLGVFDTKTNTLKVIEDTSCPASAGFGGYFDEQEDLYLIADSFGLFTKFGGFKEPKDACVLRVKKGQDVLDPSFKTKPAQALGGREPWGLYYAGKGIAYTTSVDPARINDYASVFELLFAPIHTGWLIDIAKNTGTEIKNIPVTGVGFESFLVGGRLLMPRSTGKVKIYDIENSEATVYDIKPDGTATPVFALPGSISKITKVR